MISIGTLKPVIFNYPWDELKFSNTALSRILLTASWEIASISKDLPNLIDVLRDKKVITREATNDLNTSTLLGDCSNGGFLVSTRNSTFMGIYFHVQLLIEGPSSEEESVVRW